VRDSSKVSAYETGLNYRTTNTAAPHGKDPVDITLEHLTTNHLNSPEWSAWSAVMHTQASLHVVVVGLSKRRRESVGKLTVKPGLTPDNE
jgi:hypothetical protein